MKKLGIVLTLVLGLSLVACSQGTTSSASSAEAPTTSAPVKETVASLKKVVVACSPVPHAEIMNVVKPLMKEKGFDLEVKEFSDYVQPNLAVDEGECDANYFQHKPYLDDFNEERGTKVVSIVPVHYEPFGIYAGTKKTLEVGDGDKIAVPNDVTNEARALNLLEAAGIIKLKEGAGLKATKLDIEENPNNVEIVELESAQIPRSLDSVAFACMNGNYAMQANYKATDALYLEKQDSEAAKTYANIVCVKEGNENIGTGISNHSKHLWLTQQRYATQVKKSSYRSLPQFLT